MPIIWPIVWLLRALYGGEWHYFLWSHYSLLISSPYSFTHFSVWPCRFLSNHWQHCSILTLIICPNKDSSLMRWVALIWLGKIKTSIESVTRMSQQYSSTSLEFKRIYWIREWLNDRKQVREGRKQCMSSE